jgi:DNA-binding CsgD family transcriptional regulator/tetratricopeptide (TPR) repeat protein
VAGLTDRRGERDALDRLVEAVQAGDSRVLVVQGDPGVGKTVLLDYVAERAHGCQVARAIGVQSETELAFAGLHQLCAPMLGHAERLPGPQQDALRTAFGLAAGPPPDRFLVGLGLLSLLSQVAGERPLICLIDDEQWLDRASAQALGFAARRLAADPVGLVFAARAPDAELAGLPGLEVGGLPDEDARALLDAAMTGPLDARVRDLIVAETRGNPLALLELPRVLSPAELAGGFGLPGAMPLTGRIEDSFGRRLHALPDQTRRLLQLAAADPSGDRSLVWRAAGRLGIPVQAVSPAVEAGLVEPDAGVRFRHPLVRSAAYRSTAIADRRQMHAALAEATDPAADPDRRAWHAALAAAGPDEEVAGELERCAGRAQARGGLPAAAAFLQRSALLTADPVRHVNRLLAAAQAHMQAGAFGKALDLVATAEAGPLDEITGSQVDLVRGHVALASGSCGDAAVLLVRGASRLEPLDPALARETYLSAWGAALVAGKQFGEAAQPGEGDILLEICHAVRAVPVPPGAPRPVDLMLEGLALLITGGPAAAAPALRRAAQVLTSLPVEDVVRWGWIAAGASAAVWDHEGFLAMAERQVLLVRDAGALAQLPLHLAQLGIARAWMGDFAGAASAAAESGNVAAATGRRFAPAGLLMLRALQGREDEATAAIAGAIERAAASGQGTAIPAHWAAAVLYNGLGRFAQASSSARQATGGTVSPSGCAWALPELVEAAALSGSTKVAAGALDRLAETTQSGGTDFGLGVEARCRALLSGGAAAERLYCEAIDRLGRTRLRPELARAHLLHGEWLRREGRLPGAREQLRTAHTLLAAIGMGAFADRALRELIAAGGTARQPSPDVHGQLTPHEEKIARLAGDGLSNPEIGAQLFLSGRTVEWHLRKIFAKLGIRSRRELPAALAERGQDG